MFAVRVVVTLCINALDLDVDLRAIILDDHCARRCPAKIGTSLPKVRLGQPLNKDIVNTGGQTSTTPLVV